MQVHAEEQLKEIKHLNEAEGTIFKMSAPRVTRVGRFIRNTSTDDAVALNRLCFKVHSEDLPQMDIPSQTYAAIARDFQRDVWCLFGLPVDNLTMVSTKAILRERVNQGGTTVLSTINVNWVVQSFSDPEFRSAILNSDLVTLDGKPLLWLAKLLGCPMRETVPGSSLIEELMAEETDKPLTIFLLGGEDNTAKRAMERINQRRGGLRAVGALNPGFGTVEQMSTSATINKINSTKPDILLVALGAKKGTLWIERNRNQLNAKIISHLGATINFLAGTVKRAPRLMQACGLEWAWRIIQEPKLFSRYAGDGLVMLLFFLPRLPLWWRYRYLYRQFRQEQPNTDVRVRESTEDILLSFGRNMQSTATVSFCEILNNCFFSEKKLVLNFQETEFIDGEFLGCLLFWVSQVKKSGRKVEIINCDRLAPIFKLFGLHQFSTL